MNGKDEVEVREPLGVYKNGNYTTVIFGDGSKMRFNDLDTMVPDHPESIDCKISNRCDMACEFCHEQSVPDDALANLEHPIFQSLPAYCELALGGGNVLEHPGLEEFLKRMKKQRVICNMTLHIAHFRRSFSYIKKLVDERLLTAIGVSINSPVSKDDLYRLKQIPNLVVHVIAGVVPLPTLKGLAHNNLKLLILGYKDYGRGHAYFESNPGISAAIAELEERLEDLKEGFAAIAFDNLALEQLHLKELVSEEEWERYYLGDDGQFSMYLDMVEEKYAPSSTSARVPIGDETNITQLFNNVRGFAST